MLSHHAYYLEGGRERMEELCAAVRAAAGADPEVVRQEFETFGIHEARALRDMAMLGSDRAHSVFVVMTPSMTSESQQALLKLFEEPRAGAVFVLLVPHGILLPTLRSRCLPFLAEGSGQNAGDREEHTNKLEYVRMFLGAGPKERSAEIAKLIKDPEGARERARGFLDALEAVLYGELEKRGAGERQDFVEGLEDIARFRSYLADRAPSLKMMLEHLAASLPKY